VWFLSYGNRKTDEQADILITILRVPPEDEVNVRYNFTGNFGPTFGIGRRTVWISQRLGAQVEKTCATTRKNVKSHVVGFLRKYNGKSRPFRSLKEQTDRAESDGQSLQISNHAFVWKCLGSRPGNCELNYRTRNLLFFRAVLSNGPLGPGPTSVRGPQTAQVLYFSSRELSVTNCNFHCLTQQISFSVDNHLQNDT